MHIGYIKIKRYIDFVLALNALAALLPIMLIIGLLVWLDDPGMIIFRQKRVGAGGRHFQMLKFRTMKRDTPKNVPTHLLQNPEIYVTRIGRLLRRTSLDELPQIWNILLGDMAIVGPRPALWNQYDLIALRERTGAGKLRPGLTGLAQIKGRDELPIRVKAKYDAIYANNISPYTDLCIIIITLQRVISGRGIRR